MKFQATIIIFPRIQSAPLPLGKTMGGGSTLNGMQYVRGSPQDFDFWAALGNHGWDYLSVLPYFKRSEDFRARVPVRAGGCLRDLRSTLSTENHYIL